MLRNGGKWTQSRFNSFIKSGLRGMSRRWPPKFECLADACRGAKTNKATGRLAKHYECAECHEHFPAKEVACDHIEPVVPVTGFTTWDEVIERMFVEKEGLQVLCKACHLLKSAEEKKARAAVPKDRKPISGEKSSWCNMIQRCNNPKSTGYEYYGGRGIFVAERWLSFDDFYEDMGPRPDGCSLDRIDVDDGYYKDNCRWASWVVQGNNKTDNHFVAFDGQALTLAQWEDVVGVPQNTILYRLRRGWTVGESLGLVERERPHTSRLSADEWLEVQALRDAGHTIVQLGEMFGIHHSQVSRKTVSRKCDEEKQQRKQAKG